MKKMIPKISAIFLFQLILLNVVYSQIQYFHGNITSDTTWSSDTLILTGDVIIDSNVCLNIAAGTYISIPQYTAIWSYGSIQAIGTKNDSIIFTHADTLCHSDTSTTKGGWHGIRFLPRDNPDTSIFKYCRISNGKAVIPGSFSGDHDPGNLGGNIYGTEFGSLLIEHCKIFNGRAKIDGGGIYLEFGNYVRIDSCDFRFNHAYIFGGGGHIYKINKILVSNSLFYKNTSYFTNTWGGGGQGGGMSILWNLNNSAVAIFENNQFYNNYTGCGIIYDGYKNTRITGNIICNNFGAGLWNANFYASPIYSNNTIINNVSTIWSGIVTRTPEVYIVNNIVRNNYAYPNFPVEQIHSGNYPPPTVEYSNIEFGYEGEGNIDSIPMFVNPTQGIGLEYNALLADWNLKDDSPCVNAGIYDTAGIYLPENDIAGNQRVYGNRIDIGAFENQHIIWVQNYESFASGFLVSVYPNPAKDFVIFEMDEEYFNQIAYNVEICISDLLGNVVEIQQLHSNKTMWNTSLIKPGVYIYTLTNGKDKSRGKIVIR